MRRIIIFTLTFLLSFFLFNSKTLASEPSFGPYFQAGEKIHLTGDYDQDVFLFGGDVKVDANISGDLTIFAGKTQINGSIGDDLKVAAGQIDLNAPINDNATLFSGQTRLASEALINGDLYLHSSEKAIIDSQATVSGHLIQKIFESDDSFKPELKLPQKNMVKNLTFFFLTKNIVALLIESLIGLLLISLMPKLFKSLAIKSQTEVIQSIGWGFLTLILTPLVAIIFFISLIGIPLGVFTLMLYGFTFYVARLVAGYSLGNKLLKDKQFKKYFYSLILGLGILRLLKFIPIIGWVISFILILSGLGAISIKARTALKKSRK